MKLEEMIRNTMDVVLSDYMSQKGVKTGDTTLEQDLKWVELVQGMEKLIEEITEQNKQKVEKIELPMPYVLTMLDALHVIKEHKLYGLMGDEDEVKWQIDTVISEFLDPIANSENTDDIEIVFYD
jgi:hypothetical protein